MKKLFIVSASLTLLALTTACENFVEVETPKSQLTGSEVFEDHNTANAAVIDLFAKVRDNGLITGSSLGTSVNLALYADELIYYGTADENVSHIFNNSLMATNPTARQYWNDSYHQIYCANAIIEGCQQALNLQEPYKTQFTGEAYFIRALLHFYLVNLYNDVPYITTTDYQQNRFATRMSKTQVYEQVVTDLLQAIEMLPENYQTPDRVRPNKATVKALLARVFLYQENWLLAETMATEVITSPHYVWETDLDKIFLKESTTTIWQFSPKLAGNNADEASVFIFTSGPPPFVGLNPDLVAAFQSEDLRKSHWINTITDGSNTWYHAYKYKQNTNTGTSLEYSVIFRLVEQYLIRAEARLKQGNELGAKSDLNLIRNTAGLGDTPATTEAALFDDIMLQRRLEFFTEYGHRFFDLKRTGRLNTELSPNKPGWNTTDSHWPIPETELLANPNMTQNPGY
ncbi:RagB/SusD family nutrient uptake outer membrane protein [Flavobacterium sp. SM15]|uniref:RagB/SusD family nutrient uptake outer membrane protein n=1 Tax=Flavobacterium sp. SM15 TaxID=2908005 RepID=UPI001EDBB1E7|nr:RagB/SusD family nutrient uptake outer membrane protein [Flavobacterium sp. SM15]MCG2611829.1 RagB/SusD family nutrient uptake outer membrane protein [Flavobacterium sp. SM15]